MSLRCESYYIASYSRVRRRADSKGVTFAHDPWGGRQLDRLRATIHIRGAETSRYPALRNGGGVNPCLISTAHSARRLSWLLNFAQRSRNVATPSRSPAATRLRA